MNDHTPGPWDIVFNDDVERIRLNGSTVYQVADVTDPDFPTGKPRYNLADLRLMAAAPELLDQLRMAAEFISGHNECLSVPSGSGDKEWNEYCIGLLEDCKLAITKSEGRSE